MESHAGDELDPNWLSCLLEDESSTCFDSFSLSSTIQWPSSQPFPSCPSVSFSPEDSCCTLNGQEECCRKRLRGGSSCTSSSKACREKMRRDHVNERFLELGTVLEPRKTPKLDKAAILTDAVRMVKMLHEETSRLESKNIELKQKVEELKTEKKELRTEKQRLKAEKDDMEQRVKALGAPHGLQFRPTAAIPAAYAIPSQAPGGKLMPFMNYPGVPFWQFVPHTAVDTSQDHALHPPVA